MPGGRTANIFAILVQMMPSGRAVHTAHVAHGLGENWEIGKMGGSLMARVSAESMLSL